MAGEGEKEERNGESKRKWGRARTAKMRVAAAAPKIERKIRVRVC